MIEKRQENKKEGFHSQAIHFIPPRYLRTHPEPFARPHWTISEACLNYPNPQRVNGDGVISWYVKLGYNDERVARFGALGGLASNDV